MIFVVYGICVRILLPGKTISVIKNNLFSYYANHLFVLKIEKIWTRKMNQHLNLKFCHLVIALLVFYCIPSRHLKLRNHGFYINEITLGTLIY